MPILLRDGDDQLVSSVQGQATKFSESNRPNTYQTLKFVRRTEPPEVTEIWIAPALAYQPVKVRVTDDDRTTTRVYLEQFTLLPPQTVTAETPASASN